jgi:hypothetical protein
MLEWNPRLVTLVLALLAIASFVGGLSLKTGTGHLGW